MTNRDVILLSTADWDNPFWTNKQHVACELSRLGYRVLYVDSVGLRRPSASASDMKRIIGRIRKAFALPRRVRDGVWVVSPMLLPFHGNSVVGRVNRSLLGFSFAVWSRIVGLKPSVLWTYNPITTQLVDLDRFATVVYHCVDDVKAQPGMPFEAIDSREKELVRESDVIFVTAEPLLEGRRDINPNTIYYPNVADYVHFSSAGSSGVQVPSDIATLKGPVIGFVGAISSYKIDFELIVGIARRRPDWNIVLVGKVGEGDPWTCAELLSTAPNVHLLGPRPYADLPAYLKGMNVAIMPNILNDYTLGMFPMKFFEYLAAGLPVVSVRLDSLREFAHVCRFASGADEFVSEIEVSLMDDSVAKERGQIEARRHTYESRTVAMLNDIGRLSKQRKSGMFDLQA